MQAISMSRSAALAVFASLLLAWAVPASAAAPPAAKGAQAAVVDVVLTGVAAKRLDDVRAALQRAGLTAAEAKKATAKVPAVVKRGVTAWEATALTNKLTAAGATIEVRPAAPSADARRLPASPVREARYEVVLVRAGDRPIEVIKLVREVMGLGLKAAKELVDHPPQTVERDADLATAQQVERRFAEVGAAVEIRQTSGPPPAPPAPPAPPPPADARYDVVLVDVPVSAKLEIIRRLRELLGLALREAKDLADNPPQTLRTGVDLASARDLEQRLVEAGAGIEVRLDGVASAGAAPAVGPGRRRPLRRVVDERRPQPHQRGEGDPREHRPRPDRGEEPGGRRPEARPRGGLARPRRGHGVASARRGRHRRDPVAAGAGPGSLAPCCHPTRCSTCSTTRACSTWCGAGSKRRTTSASRCRSRDAAASACWSIRCVTSPSATGACAF
jgi:large subunit ribosomal protein L7/L12